MNTKHSASPRSRALLVLMGALALVAAACAQPPAPTSTETATFVSNLTGAVHIDVFVPGETPEEDATIPVDIPLSGNALGSWVKSGSGPFNANLTLDGGQFDLEAPGVGTVGVAYSVESAAVATGAFAPSTGEGGFSTSAVLTVDSVTIPTGDPENPAVLDFTATQCDVGLDMDLAGAIDAATGMLSVSQDSFHVDVPADTDCANFGAVIGDLLGGPDNTASIGLRVHMGA